MKQLTLILALSIAFASCKKQNNTPNQQSTQNSTTTPTTTPTSTTTANDTVGKVKLLYSFYFYPQQTNIYNFKQDSNNIHFYHDTTSLTNNYINYFSIIHDEISQIGNYNANNLNDNKAIWCNHGDSIVVIIDSLEFLPPQYVTETVFNQAFLKALITIKTVDYQHPWTNTTYKFYPMQDSWLPTVAKQFPTDRNSYANTYWSNIINLGQVPSSSSGFVYYLGGQYRFVYYVQ